MHFYELLKSKWSLTGFLLLALSTSITFPPKPLIQSLDLAVTAPETAGNPGETLKTNVYLSGIGTKEVVFTRVDDRTTQAQVSCTDCELNGKPVILNADIKNVIELINQFNQSIEKDSPKKAASAVATAEVAATEKTAEKKSAELSDLEKQGKICDEKSDDNEILTCHSENLEQQMTRDDAKNRVTQVVAVSYYKKRIGDSVTSTILKQARKDSRSNFSLFRNDDSDDDNADAVIAAIQSLYKACTSKYSKVAEAILTSQAKADYNQSRKMTSLMKQEFMYLDQKDYTSAQYAHRKLQEEYSVYNMLGGVNQSLLSEAKGSYQEWYEESYMRNTMNLKSQYASLISRVGDNSDRSRSRPSNTSSSLDTWLKDNQPISRSGSRLSNRSNDIALFRDVNDFRFNGYNNDFGSDDDIFSMPRIGSSDDNWHSDSRDSRDSLRNYNRFDPFAETDRIGGDRNVNNFVNGSHPQPPRRLQVSANAFIPR